MKSIIIATRSSELALWQAQHVADLLESELGCKVSLLPMKTTGDRRLEVSLNKIGGKGLFLKELEQAMMRGDADLAVHSMKDVPADLPEAFTIAAILPRADSSDAFVSNCYESMDQLPEGAIVGTSSLRRQAQMLRERPDIQIKSLRGNINTRLKKLDDKQYDAIILASAGLIRLSKEHRIRQKLNTPEWLPAVAQGAIGIECLSENTALSDMLSVLNDQNTSLCINSERTFNQRLGGSCSVAIGASARLLEQKIIMDAAVFSSDGQQKLHCSLSGDEPGEIGIRAAEELIVAGAERILNEQKV